MRHISKTEFLEDRRKCEDVPTPELGEGTVLRVRELNARERREYMVAIKDREADGYAFSMAQLIAICSVDPETGERLFTQEDVPAIAEKPERFLMRLGDLIAEMSVISRKAVEEQKKDSPATPDASSSSGSAES